MSRETREPGSLWPRGPARPCAQGPDPTPQQASVPLGTELSSTVAGLLPANWHCHMTRPCIVCDMAGDARGLGSRCKDLFGGINIEAKDSPSLSLCLGPLASHLGRGRSAMVRGRAPWSRGWLHARRPPPGTLREPSSLGPGHPPPGPPPQALGLPRGLDRRLGRPALCMEGTASRPLLRRELPGARPGTGPWLSSPACGLRLG